MNHAEVRQALMIFLTDLLPFSLEISASASWHDAQTRRFPLEKLTHNDGHVNT